MMKRTAVEEVNNLMLPVAAAKRIAVEKIYNLIFPVAYAQSASPGK